MNSNCRFAAFLTDNCPLSIVNYQLKEVFLMKYIVNVPRCPLQLHPTHDGEQADEMMLGWGCEILEEAAPGWVKVRTDYRYEGYAPVECLTPDKGWTCRSKKVVTKGYCTVLSLPKVQGGLVCDLPRGALVAPIAEPDENHWVKVLLPDGREGYTKESYLGIFTWDGPSMDGEPEQQRYIAKMAKKIYQWRMGLI